MLGRQSVKVTYAHKKRRVQNASKKLLSSPLEVLPPDTDDLTRTQMARRMLKRSRRVALAEQLEDANVEHIRDHLAKRIKRTQEHVSNPESAEVPLHAAEHDFTFQTPFASSQVIREPTVAQPLVPDQLSPVPAAKRVVSRPSSRNLKENGPQPHILASPFSSRPGSAAPSPRHKGKSRSSRRVSRISLHAKSRTLSGVLKENTRGVSRKDSTVSLKDANRESSIKHIKHRRYPSSPSTAYMRSRSVQDGWISPPKVFSRTFDDFNEILSPAGSAHSNASFYTDQPQSCSTPAMSRLRKLPDLHGQRARADGLLASFSMRKGVAEAGGPDVEMIDGTAPSRRQTIHLSGNSIFSSSDEFTIASLPAMLHDGEIVEKNSGSGPNESLARVVCQAPAPRGAVDGSQVGRSIAGSFVAEYAISLPDLDHSPASTTATKMLGPAGVPKLSIGEQLLGLPGTSPVRGNNLVIRASRNPGPPKSSVGEQPFGLPGTSPACGENLVIRTSRDHGTLTPPASPLGETVTCPPSSPASDLALELQSMGICGMFPKHCISLIVPGYPYFYHILVPHCQTHVSLLAASLDRWSFVNLIRSR